MKIEQITSLTLKRQAFRKHGQICALQVKQYPVYPMLTFFEGYDQSNYDGNAWVKDAIADGFENFKHASKPFIEEVHGIVTWGQLSILRQIVENAKTTLVLEDDTLLGIDYPDLQRELDALSQHAPVTPKCVLLSFWRKQAETRTHLQPVKNAEFWVQGVKGQTQSAVIYTPEGAEEILTYYRTHPEEIRSVEFHLWHVMRDEPYMYTAQNPCAVTSILQGRSIMYQNTVNPNSPHNYTEATEQTRKTTAFFGIEDGVE